MGKVSVQRVVLPAIHPSDHPFIHSFNKYVLSTFKMPEASLRIRNIVWKKKKKTKLLPSPWSTVFRKPTPKPLVPRTVRSPLFS